MLGAEDLAADLCAERTPVATELEYARRCFLLECRAGAIEPIDAPYTFCDAEGAAQEARASRAIGCRARRPVRPEHAAAVRTMLISTPQELARAQEIVAAFEAARARVEVRVLVAGLRVPTYDNALRLLASH